MELFINIMLLTFGFVGAITAFGGETWTKTEAPLPKRITIRGWVSISCLALALTFGIIKEIRTSYASADDAKNRSSLEQQLQLTRQQVETTQKKLDDANDRLKDMPRLRDSFAFDIPPNGTYRLLQPVFGGDEIKYSGVCDSLILEVEGKTYSLNPYRAIIIQGIKGKPMYGIIRNTTDQNCNVKTNVYSIESKPY
jgi:hypothetical protein